MKYIFIISPARSGSKFLRSLLSAPTQHAEVPYDIAYIWKHNNHQIPHDEVGVADIRDQQSLKSYIEGKMMKCSIPKANDLTTCLVEKTVSNCFRVEYLYRLFPDSHFVYLYRELMQVLPSSLRCWKSKNSVSYSASKFRTVSLSDYAYFLQMARRKVASIGLSKPPIWGPIYSGMEMDYRIYEIEELCAIQWRRCIEAVQKSFTKIPRSQRSIVNYDELIMDPLALTSLCNDIGMPESERCVQLYRETLRRPISRDFEEDVYMRDLVQKYTLPWHTIKDSFYAQILS